MAASARPQTIATYVMLAACVCHADQQVCWYWYSLSSALEHYHHPWLQISAYALLPHQPTGSVTGKDHRGAGGTPHYKRRHQGSFGAPSDLHHISVNIRYPSPPQTLKTCQPSC
jgi:hypothetical protein